MPIEVRIHVGGGVRSCSQICCKFLHWFRVTEGERGEFVDLWGVTNNWPINVHQLGMSTSNFAGFQNGRHGNFWWFLSYLTGSQISKLSLTRNSQSRIMVGTAPRLKESFFDSHPRSHHFMHQPAFRVPQSTWKGGKQSALNAVESSQTTRSSFVHGNKGEIAHTTYTHHQSLFSNNSKEID